MLSKQEFQEKFEWEMATSFAKFREQYKWLSIFKILSISLTATLWSIILILLSVVSIDVVLILSWCGLAITAATMFIWAFAFKRANSFARDIKRFIFKTLLEGYEFDYTRKGKLDERALIDSKLFSLVAPYEFISRDEVRIKVPKKVLNDAVLDCFINLRNIAVYQLEEGKGKSRTLIYSGCFGRVEHVKDIQCTIMANRRTKGLAQLELEGVEFNRKYKCYTDNQHYSRKMLTPTLMNKLLQLSAVTKHKTTFLWRGTNLDFFLPYHQVFRWKVRGTKLNFKDVENIYDDLSAVNMVIQELENNKKI